MQSAYITTGHLINKNTIKLDEDFSLSISKFRVVLEPVGIDKIKINSPKRKKIKKFKPIHTKGRITTDEIIAQERR